MQPTEYSTETDWVMDMLRQARNVGLLDDKDIMGDTLTEIQK